MKTLEVTTTTLQKEFDNESRKYTGYKDENGAKIFLGDTLKVVLRNNAEFTGKVIKSGKYFCVDIGRELKIGECYKDNYNRPLEFKHPKCGWRYAVFYVDAPNNQSFNSPNL